jgi:hypothetical protein
MTMKTSSGDDTPASHKRSSGPCGCVLGFLILLGGMFIVLTVFNEGWDALLAAPWAHPLFGRPILTGSWTGEFTSPTGIKFALYLDLERAKRPDGRYDTERSLGAILTGQAQWCDNQGRHAEDIPLGGSAPSFAGFNGSLAGLHLALDRASHPQVGLMPDEFDGSWQTDTLTLTPTFLVWDGSDYVISSSNPDLTQPITIVLKRGDQNAFKALCNQAQ